MKIVVMRMVMTTIPMLIVVIVIIVNPRDLLGITGPQSHARINHDPRGAKLGAALFPMGTMTVLCALPRPNKTRTVARQLASRLAA